MSAQSHKQTNTNTQIGIIESIFEEIINAINEKTNQLTHAQTKLTPDTAHASINME